MSLLRGMTVALQPVAREVCHAELIPVNEVCSNDWR